MVFFAPPRSRPRRGTRRAAARAPRGRSAGCPAAARARRRSPAAAPDLWTRSVMQSYSASRFLPKCAGNRNDSAMLSSTSCLDCASARFAYRKCWPASWRLHQILHAVGADRLNDVRTDGLQLHGLVPPRSHTKLSPAPCSLRDAAEARVVVVGVVAGLGVRRLVAAADDAPRAPVTRARRAVPCTRGSSRARCNGSSRSRLPNTMPSLAYGNGPPLRIRRSVCLRFPRQLGHRRRRHRRRPLRVGDLACTARDQRSAPE